MSDQLTTLRRLLERRRDEPDELNYRTDLSAYQKSSPETFTKEFLQSYKYENPSRDLISDVDDEDRDKYHSDALSSSSTSTLTDSNDYQQNNRLSTSNYQTRNSLF